MNPGLTVEFDVRFHHSGRGARKVIAAGAAPPALPSGHIPRVARLMALAIRFDGLIRDRVVPDYASLARLGRVTRARITQIMNLTLLAPDIQEQLLFLPPIERGRDPLPLRLLQPIALTADWNAQRRMWREVLGRLNLAAPSVVAESDAMHLQS